MARKPKWLVIDGCPVPYDIAPYVYLITRRAGQRCASVYRGEDPAAKRILNAHGKHTQGQLVNATPAQRAAWGVMGTPNPVGLSQHELANWRCGVDSGGDTSRDKRATNKAAHHYRCSIHHPYPDSPVEGHHWQFTKKPKARGPLMRARVIYLRRRLPRH